MKLSISLISSASTDVEVRILNHSDYDIKFIRTSSESLEPYLTPRKCVTIPLVFDSNFDAAYFSTKWKASVCLATAEQLGYTPKAGCAVDFANAHMFQRHKWCYLPFSEEAMGEGWVHAAFDGMAFADLPPPGCVPTLPHTVDDLLRQIVELCDCVVCKSAASLC
eukprot:3355118-Rhodomonas_salina.2